MKLNSASFEIGLVAQVGVQARQADFRKREPEGPAESAQLANKNSEASKQPHNSSQPIVNGYGLGLEFSMDDVTGHRVVKIYDLDSGEVVRQIPPEEVLAFMRQLQEVKGLLISRRL